MPGVHEILNKTEKPQGINKTVQMVSYIYIILPILIFMMGWVKWIVSIPTSLIIVYSLYTAYRKSGHQYIYPKVKEKGTIIIAFVIICGWVFLSGVGGFVYQNGDHKSRNAIFRVLVEYDWPILKNVIEGGQIQTRMLSYYIGYWLPAAVVGKIFDLSLGFVFQAVWAVLGIVLVYHKISARFGRYSVVPLLIFIFFSGLDILGFPLLGKEPFIIGTNQHIEFWGVLQFSSHTTQLFWVYNQAIYGWLLTLMLLEEEDNRHLVLIWSCGLLECTFPFVGMLPFLCFKILKNFQKRAKNDSTGKALRELFSIENVLGAGLIGIITFTFLLNNSAADNNGTGLPITLRSIMRYLVFLSFEVSVYYIPIYKHHRKDPLFYISLLMLMICPLIRVGGSIDFCMRASIPSLLVLCLLVTDSLVKTWKTSKRHFAVLLIVFLLGSITPIHEIGRTIENTSGFEDNLRFDDEEGVFAIGNFSSDTADNLFYQYLSK